MPTKNYKSNNDLLLIIAKALYLPNYCGTYCVFVIAIIGYVVACFVTFVFLFCCKSKTSNGTDGNEKGKFSNKLVLTNVSSDHCLLYLARLGNRRRGCSYLLFIYLLSFHVDCRR
jgi:hypothetical protein